MKVEYISKNKQTFENLCRVRGVESATVSRICEIIPRQNAAYQEFIAAKDIYGKAIEKFSENYNSATNDLKRSPEEQEKYEKHRQKAKWDVNDKKNFMIQKQIEKELIVYESFRDALALPNFVSPKSPKGSPKILKTVEFDRKKMSSRLRAHEIIEALDIGGKANSRLTSGSSSRFEYKMS